MNKHFRKVLEKLKTRAKQLGFSRKELKGIAAKVADNLDLEEDASDEDVDSAIDEKLDEVMEYLEPSQSAAQRAISNYKKAHPVKDDDSEDSDDEESDEEDEEEEEPRSKKNQRNKKSKKDSEEDGGETPPSWAKKLFAKIDETNERLAKVEGNRTADSRRAKLQKILEGTDRWGERKLRDFDRIASTFKDDEDFEDYLDQIQEDLDDYNQERANSGLKKLGPSAATIKKSKRNKEEDEAEDEDVDSKKLTDKELDELADMY